MFVNEELFEFELVVLLSIENAFIQICSMRINFYCEVPFFKQPQQINNKLSFINFISHMCTHTLAHTALKHRERKREQRILYACQHTAKE